MSAASTQLREWANEDRTQASVIDWLVAVGDGDPSLSGAQAENLRATADGWDEVADAVEVAEGEVGDPQGPGPDSGNTGAPSDTVDNDNDDNG